MIRCLETRYGAIYVPDTDIGQYDWLEETGASVEDEQICKVLELLAERPKGVFFDVGASFGCWTLALAPHCGQVMAFEPQRAVNELLSRSVRENRLKNVRVFEAALGGQIGHIDVAALDLSADANFGGLSLGVPLEDQPFAPSRTVEMHPLDDFTEGLEVSGIKMDVEGMEADVVAGALKTLDRCRPILFLETDHPRTDRASLLASLDRLGYAVQPRGPNALCLPL